MTGTQAKQLVVTKTQTILGCVESFQLDGYLAKEIVKYPGSGDEQFRRKTDIASDWDIGKFDTLGELKSEARNATEKRRTQKNSKIEYDAIFCDGELRGNNRFFGSKDGDEFC